VTWESLLAEITNGDHDPEQQLFVYNLIPFPYCITKEGSVRKMGVSVGPKKFIECFDRMKFAPLINSQNILAEDSRKVQVCSHFRKNGGDMQEDDMIFSLENFSQQLSSILLKKEEIGLKSMNILIGGSNQILESYLKNSATSESRDLCLLKLSPKSGLQESFADQSLANESFLTEVSNSFVGS